MGRTGTVILIDAMYKMGRQEQAVDVYRQLTIIREQRANLCANQAQYQLVHQVLVELLVSPSTSIPAAQLASRLPQLKSVADGPSGLEQQLSYLASNPPPASFTSARGEQLEGKNRSPEILPGTKAKCLACTILLLCIQACLWVILGLSLYSSAPPGINSFIDSLSG